MSAAILLTQYAAADAADASHHGSSAYTQLFAATCRRQIDDKALRYGAPRRSFHIGEEIQCPVLKKKQIF